MDWLHLEMDRIYRQEQEHKAAKYRLVKSLRPAEPATRQVLQRTAEQAWAALAILVHRPAWNGGRVSRGQGAFRRRWSA